jgi:nicotinate-nucleotide pyrophosphorylase (carboxylating)
MTSMFNGSMSNFKIDECLLRALAEDITSEDITTNAIIATGQKVRAELLCKEEGMLAGRDVFARVFTLLDDNMQCEFFFCDGDLLSKGDLVGIVTGDARTVLSGERTALNYLQHMSGVATLTHLMVQELAGTKTKLLDTRKTTPNLRIFEKYAVKVGGGHNHRYNLSDGVMIKDNHIAAAGSIKKAVELVRAYASFVKKIEVEAENLTMVAEAIEAGADIIMLDNMDKQTMEQAVKMIAGRALTECSGNVTLQRLRELATIGVDYVSSGALTHSARNLDLSLKNLVRL